LIHDEAGNSSPQQNSKDEAFSPLLAGKNGNCRHCTAIGRFSLPSFKEQLQRLEAKFDYFLNCITKKTNKSLLKLHEMA